MPEWLGWDEAAVSPLVSTEKGLSLLVLGQLEGRPTGVLHLRIDGTDVRVSEVTALAGRLPAYITLTVRHSRELIGAAIGAGGVIEVVRSADEGAHWSPPVTVRPAGSGRVLGLRTKVDERGVVHLLWVESEDATTWPSVLKHALSRDGGTTWDHGPGLVVHGGILSFDVAADQCGLLHVVYEGAESQLPRVGYARWNGHAWVQADGPKLTPPAIEPTIAHGRQHAVYAFWTRPSVEFSKSPEEFRRRPRYETVFSRLR